MLSFFFLVALFNICLGYAVAVLFPPSKVARMLAARSLRGRFAVEPASDSEIAAAPAGKQAQHVAVSSGDGLADAVAPLVAAPPTASDPAPPAPPQPTLSTENWEEFSKAMQPLLDRVAYVRSIQDSLLGQEIASQLQGAVEAWYDDLSKQLDAHDDKPFLSDDDVMNLEQFMAQLETTLTNLKMIDWSSELDSALSRLEKEIRIVQAARPELAMAKA